MRAILTGGLVDPTALREDYLDELLNVGHRTGYPTVARSVYRSLPTLAAARARYPEVTAPVHLIYWEKDWSRPSDWQANRRQLPNAGRGAPHGLVPPALPGEHASGGSSPTEVRRVKSQVGRVPDAETEKAPISGRRCPETTRRHRLAVHSSMSGRE